MDENLIGYLLDALDSDTRLETEKDLLKNPEARERLASLRQALEPLESDREADEPPPDLWVRTLARVAEHRCRHLPAAPKASSDRPVHRSWWRRADVMVAAGLLLCVSSMIPSVLAKVRFQRDLVACQNNLHNFYIGLKDFSERHHGNFPDVATAVPAPQLESRAWNLGGSYAYSLGYSDNTGDHGPRLDPQLASSMRPLVADRPPRDIMLGATTNSPNHGGAGQNVLFMDGHCVYCTQRVLPCAAGGFDDIYLNQDNQVHAGRSPWDTVLGDSQAHP